MRRTSKANVEQNQIDVFLLQQRQRRFSARHHQDAVVALQDGADRVAHPLVVVADENRFCGGHR
jgi:hypothetical protein